MRVVILGWMARPLRVEYPGAIYHVTGRMLGNWKKELNLLFEDDRDRLRFIERLGERVEQFEVRLFLLTLMSNHFHLVLETPLGNLGRFMHSLSTAYTIYFNLRHGRHGHLLDGRYKAKLVEGDEYLLALSRYVHLNPVYTGLMARKPLKERIDHLRRYRWSSYPGYIGRRKQFEFVEPLPILAQMKGAQRTWPQRYREYVETGLAQCDDEFRKVLKASPLCIGGEFFRAKIHRMYEKRVGGRSGKEDVSFRKMIEPLPVEQVMGVVGRVLKMDVAEFSRQRRDSVVRGVAARMLCRYSGLTQREVAEVLGMGSGSGVSHQLRKLGEMEKRDSRLRRQLGKMETELTKTREKGSGRNK